MWGWRVGGIVPHGVTTAGSEVSEGSTQRLFTDSFSGLFRIQNSELIAVFNLVQSVVLFLLFPQLS